MDPTLMLFAGLGAIFLSLTLALSLIGVATGEKRAVGRSLAAIQTINAAPEAMRQELDRPFTERVLTPLLTKSVRIGKRFTPADTITRIRHRLDLAGNPEGWDVDRVVGLKVLGFLLALSLTVSLSMLLELSLVIMLLFSVSCSMAGFSAPNLWIYQKGYDREQQLRKELPDAIDLLTISVEAGLGFDAALARVARNTEGPLGAEFARVLQEMQIGVGRIDAIRAMGERSTVPELRSFVTAMVQADAFGIPIGQVLRVQSSEIRTKRRQRAEQKAQKVPVKILFPLIFCILPTLFVAVLGPAVINILANFAGMG